MEEDEEQEGEPKKEEPIVVIDNNNSDLKISNFSPNNTTSNAVSEVRISFTDPMVPMGTQTDLTITV